LYNLKVQKIRLMGLCIKLAMFHGLIQRQRIPDPSYEEVKVHK
jgi:hypothetical protein